MHKFTQFVGLMFLGALVFQTPVIAEPTTATDIVQAYLKDNPSPSPEELQDLMDRLPPLTDEEKEQSEKDMSDARLSSDPCDHPKCYAKCMMDANAAVCCKGQVCVGGSCDFGKCIGNPSRGNAYASLACGIKCLFHASEN